MASVKLAIDFGSIDTNIYLVGSGLVLSEPTVATVDVENMGEIKLFGHEAKKMIGKTSKNTKVVFPVFEGEIVNQMVAVSLLDKFLEKLEIKNANSCHVLFSVPCGVTAEMINKYKRVSKICGIAKVNFVEAPILSIIGQRVPFNNSSSYFVIDMAGGATNIAAVSMDGVVSGVSLNYGANNINIELMDYIAETYGLQIGLLSAEKLKNEIGSLAQNDMLATVVNGRDLETGAPRSISIKADDVKIPVRKYYDRIYDYANALLTKLPPEISAEVRRLGIYVSGIASTIYGLEKYYTDKFGVKINIAENAGLSVALGGGMVLEDGSLLKKVAISEK